MKKFSVLFIVFSILAVLVVPVSAQDGDDMDEPSIADIVVASATAEEDAQFTVLLAAVQAAELVEVLDETGPYTVFAPTDEAFAALLEALGVGAEDLLADTELLTSVLLYHVVPGTFYAEDVIELDGISAATAFSGSSVDISLDGESVFVDGAQVIATDIEASNGVIHVIDSVILPDEMEGSLDTMSAEPGESSIAEIAISFNMAETPEFTVLVAAAVEAGYADALTNGGPFTVFAPTDEAFAELLAALDVSAEDLLADTELLSVVLAYHVVPFPYAAADVVALDGAYIGTLLPGYALAVSVEDGAAYMNDAQIIMTDVFASNGIIHVIDSVLVPAMEAEME